MKYLARTDLETGNIDINLHEVWAITGTQAKFIRKFNDVVIHESLHAAITEPLMSLGVSDNDRLTKYYIGEERVVRKMLGQKLEKSVESKYKRLRGKHEENNRIRRTKRSRRNV